MSTEASLTHNTPMISFLDISRLESEELNPDEPEEVLQKELMNDAQQPDIEQQVEPNLETINLTVKEKKGTEEEPEDEERVVPTGVRKEPVRRICRRLKLVEKEKGR